MRVSKPPFCVRCTRQCEHAHRNVLTHHDLTSNIFYKSVHLVYQKLNETKSFLDFGAQADLFKYNTLY